MQYAYLCSLIMSLWDVPQVNKLLFNSLKLQNLTKFIYEYLGSCSLIAHLCFHFQPLYYTLFTYVCNILSALLHLCKFIVFYFDKLEVKCTQHLL